MLRVLEAGAGFCLFGLGFFKCYPNTNDQSETVDALGRDNVFR